MKKLLLVFVLAVFSIPAFSQFFQPSSVPETLIPDSESIDINDITCYSYGNLRFDNGEYYDLYISTWLYASGKGLYWKRTENGNPNNILDEGVLNFAGMVYGAVILKNIDPTLPYSYSIAVIHDAALEFYQWDLSGLSLIGGHDFGNNLLIMGASIDAHELTSFAVVWEEFGGDLYSLGGVIDASGFPVINGTVQLDFAPSSIGFRPDIAINNGSGAGGSGLKVYYTYINETMNEVHVSSLEFDELTMVPSPANLTLNNEHIMVETSITIPPTPPNPPPPPAPHPVVSNFYYSSPKIDAPDHSGDKWAIVVYEIDYKTDLPRYLSGWVRTAYSIPGLIPPIREVILNNGTLPSMIGLGLDMHELANGRGSLAQSKPVIAFDKDGNHIHYAWAKTQSHPNLEDARDYLGLMLDPNVRDAVPSASGQLYRIIDFNPSLEPVIRVIALSPQNEHTDDLFIVFEAKTQGINPQEALYYKHADWNDIPAIGYSAENPNNPIDQTTPLIYQYYPNPIEGKFTIVLNESYINDELWIGIYNVEGKLLENHEGHINDINKFLSHYFTTHNNANLRFVHLKSLNSSKSETIKLIKE